MSDRTRPEAVQRLVKTSHAYRQALDDNSISGEEFQRRVKAYQEELNMTSESEQQASDAQLRRERRGSS